MKIKTQLRIFLIGVILVPVLAAFSLPVYHYLNRPERMLFDGYKQVRQLNDYPLSKRDISVFKQLLHTLPPNVEFMILADFGDINEILVNTIPEFQERKIINEDELFQFMNETSNSFFYQIVSPPLETVADIIFISRINRDYAHDKKNGFFERAVRNAMIFIAVFEIFCILLIISLSNTISRSITILNKNTQKIADGELDVKLEYEKNTKTDNEITSLTENLDKMRLTIKDNEERRTKFIMGISHDLRTPVAVIKGYTEAMIEGFYDTPEENKNSLAIISSKTEQLETMINTLINFVKLNQTDWLQQLKEQNIVPIFQEFAEGAVTTGGIFKRNVTADIKLTEEILLPFDKELVQRALENLFSNALRYTNENDSIEISAAEENNGNSNKNLVFKIKDSGIGIKEEDLEKIFDMFYRASSSRREEGMGIGLATVMTIIKAHGWQIGVNSEYGKGSEFVITIPLKLFQETV
ncbi:ATP-binding protein [Treponema sp.]|uniref:sensor histidine kinase n=1 Tax=Treponema sp. TaxID=166 RepID=UPI00388E0A34